jgi:hypothetical protein
MGTCYEVFFIFEKIINILHTCCIPENPKCPQWPPLTHRETFMASKWGGIPGHPIVSPGVTPEAGLVPGDTELTTN